MIQRLANVIYWVAASVSMLLFAADGFLIYKRTVADPWQHFPRVVGGMVIPSNVPPIDLIIIIGAIGAGVWLAAAAFCYILTGYPTPRREPPTTN